MTQTAKEYFDSLSDRLDFERIYLAEHARCLELEAQLNSLRDAARTLINAYAGTGTSYPGTVYPQSLFDRLQDELNKE